MSQLHSKNDGVWRRARYAAIALAIAMLVSWPTLLSPLDRLTWTFQAKVGEGSASGDVVFVEVRDNALASSQDRNQLQSALKTLNESSAKSVFIDLARSGLDRSLEDNLLRQELENHPNAFVVGRQFDDLDSIKLIYPPAGLFGDDNQVIADEEPDFLDFVWLVPSRVAIDGGEYQTFASAIADDASPRTDPMEIDYRLDAAGLTTMTLDDLARGLVSADEIQGRDFIFGYGTSSSIDVANIPGSGIAPRSYTAIYAAETAKQGAFVQLGSKHIEYLPLLIVCSLLLLGAIIAGKRARIILYAMAVGALIFTIFAPIFLPFRTGISGGLVVLTAYGSMSLFNRWRAKIKLESNETGLPNLQKLELDLKILGSPDRKALIAAKLHDFDDVMAMLTQSEKSEYFQLITKRLRIADTDLTVYSNSSDKLLFLQNFETSDILKSHLTALLSIFKTPLRLKDRTIDVSITFGVDLNFDGDPHKRIGAAEALTNKTSLSAQPIVCSDTLPTVEDEWKISLQAKIDAAMSANEIFPVFQPQVDIRSGDIVGYEGLVRWKDKERGFISPSYFIEQCEHAGRMEKLQQFMLRRCIDQFIASPVIDSDVWLSVNVSATLLSDNWLAEHVEQTLEQTGFDPKRLVLEITETARIHDHVTASAVLNSLADLGLELSLDDFGTGVAGYETFSRLPFSEIKVDRHFTSGLIEDAKSRAIVANMLALGRELDLRVIVEGVEDSETCEILCEMGCKYAQGYFFGKPEIYLSHSENKEMFG